MSAAVERRLLLWLGAVAFVAFIAIAHPFGLYFLCDDWAHVPASINGNFFHTHLLRPLVYLSLWADIQLWGMDATGFHFTNLVWHLGSSVLVYLLTKRLAVLFNLPVPQFSILPLGSALLFLVWGFHSEPLFWIVGRDAVIGTFFILLSLTALLSKGKAIRVLSVLFFVGGLLSYELSWMTPFFATLVLWVGSRVHRRPFQWGWVAVYWIVFGLYLLLRFGILRLGVGYGAQAVLDFRAPVLLRNLGALLARLFTPPLQQGGLFAGFTAIVFIAAVWFGYRTLRLHRQLLLFFAVTVVLMVAALLPAIAVGIDTHDTEGERVLYLASVFCCMLQVGVLLAIVKQGRSRVLALSAVVVVHLFLLQQAGKTYRYASDVSKTLISALNRAPSARTVSFTGLPTQYRGALLFRIGFPVYAPGLLPVTYDSVKILSWQELQSPLPFVVDDQRTNKTAKSLQVVFSDTRIILR